MNPPSVVIAGGGTGGHVVPGLAVAAALVDHGLVPAAIHWVGSERGMEVDAVPAAGYELTVLPGRGIERKVTVANIANIAGIAIAVLKGIALIRRLRPDVVVSLGGYAAVPAAIGAVVWRVPIVIQEQNATPSLANRLVSRFAKRASVPVEGTGLRREVVTGNPINEMMVEAAAEGDRIESCNRLGLDPERVVVAAFGGSLGARRINHAVIDLAERWVERDDVSIHHVIGRRDWPDLEPRVRALEAATVHNRSQQRERLQYQAVEYEDRMADVLTSADIAVCRAGGMTISELTSLGVPAILVPLPIAPNDAQRANARALVDGGAALLMDDADLDASTLERQLTQLVDTTSRREAMADASRKLGRPDAASAIASLIMEVADAS